MFDALHVLHVNLIWALLEDTQDVAIQTSWIHIQHTFALQDETWEIEDDLSDSTPEELSGCSRYLDNKIKAVEAPNLGLSRQASMMGDSSFRDYRLYLGGKIEQFSVRDLLMNLDKQSKQFSSIDAFIIRNLRDANGNRVNIKEQAKA